MWLYLLADILGLYSCWMALFCQSNLTPTAKLNFFLVAFSFFILRIQHEYEAASMGWQIRHALNALVNLANHTSKGQQITNLGPVYTRKNSKNTPPAADRQGKILSLSYQWLFRISPHLSFPGAKRRDEVNKNHFRENRTNEPIRINEL